jgi:small-conductance mechanosensitive channel
MQALLGTTFLGNSGLDWVIAVAVTAVTYLFLRTFVSVTLRRIKKLAARTTTDVDDLVAELLDKTRFIFIALIALWAGSLYLDLPPVWDAGLRHVLVIGVFLQAAFWANGLINYGLNHYKAKQLEDDPGMVTALGAIGFLIRVAAFSVIAMMVLSNLGIDVGPLIASLGIGGIAIALALQNVLGDLFASISIVFDKPFLVGDYIQVGTFQGTVEHVGLKTSRLKSISGEQLIFNNSDLLGSRISNYKRRADRRVQFSLGVTYDTPKAKLEQIPGWVEDIISSKDATRFDRCFFLTFGDSALVFDIVYYMDVPDFEVYGNNRQAINLEILGKFAEEGVEFAYPTQTVIVANPNPS